MVKLQLLLLLASLAFLQVEGTLEEAREWVEREYETVSAGMVELEARLREAWRGDDLEGVRAVQLQLASLPAPCAAQARQALAAQWPDFFHCPNLTVFQADMNGLVFGGLNLTRLLLKTAVDFFHGYSHCTSWLPWKAVPCYLGNTYQILKDFRKSYTMINDYFTGFLDTAKNMTAEFEYCKVNSPPIFTVVHTLAPAYECAANHNK